MSYAEERCDAKLIQVDGYILTEGGRRKEGCKKVFLHDKTEAHLMEKRESRGPGLSPCKSLPSPNNLLIHQFHPAVLGPAFLAGIGVMFNLKECYSYGLLPASAMQPGIKLIGKGLPVTLIECRRSAGLHTRRP